MRCVSSSSSAVMSRPESLLMEFIVDSAVLQRADDIFNNYSTTTRVAVWAVVLGEIIVVVREDK